MIGVRTTRFTILFAGLAVWVIGVFTGPQFPAILLIMLGAALFTLGLRSKAWRKDPAD